MDVYYEYDRGMMYTQEYLRDFQNGMSLFKVILLQFSQ